MASLTHVCMWRENGWKPITAYEASILHPGGTVSAHSGLFMCELCGQYVLLTDGTYQVRHFRHSSAEKSKDCPERTFGAGVSYTYDVADHELPIKICNISSNGFELLMGFIRVPDELFTSKLRIEIHSNTFNSHPYVYLKERLRTDGISYLSIGKIPSEEYGIVVSGTSNDIYKFWPKIVKGIDKDGTIFDGASGRRLVTDSDVVIGKKYYLLHKGAIYHYSNSHVTINELSRKSAWCLYEVIANDYDKETAKFFLDYHCRLTDNPITMRTVWPICIEGPYTVKHNQDKVIIHLSGNATSTKVFPKAYVKTYSCQNGSVLEITCNSRQQLISAGRTKALQYSYFWKESLKETTKKPVVTVTDFYRKLVSEGEHYEIPDKGILRVLLPYDGIVNIKLNGTLIERRKIQANIPTEIGDIDWNMFFEICIGLDIVWRATFKQKLKTVTHINDKLLLQQLRSYTGSQIKIPHTIGSIASEFNEYPSVRQWIYKCIRSGKMNERAFLELKRMVINDRNKKV